MAVVDVPAVKAGNAEFDIVADAGEAHPFLESGTVIDTHQQLECFEILLGIFGRRQKAAENAGFTRIGGFRPFQ